MCQNPLNCSWGRGCGCFAFILPWPCLDLVFWWILYFPAKIFFPAKIYFSSKFFLAKFFVQNLGKTFLAKILFQQKFFWQIFFWQIFFLANFFLAKIFWSKKIGSEICFRPKILGPDKLWIYRPNLSLLPCLEVL